MTILKKMHKCQRGKNMSYVEFISIMLNALLRKISEYSVYKVKESILLHMSLDSAFRFS